MGKNDKYKYGNRSLEAVSDHFEEFLKMMFDKSRSLEKSVSDKDKSSAAELARMAGHMHVIRNQVHNLIQLYDMEIMSDIPREAFNPAAEIDRVIKSIRNSKNGTAAVIEMKIPQKIPSVFIDKRQFKKWMRWLIGTLYRNPDVDKLQILSKLNNGNIVISLIASAPLEEEFWNSADFMMAQKFFELMGGGLDIAGSREIQVILEQQDHAAAIDVLDSSFEEARTIVNKIREGVELPTLSPVATKIVNLALDESSSAKDIAAVMTVDPALTSKVIRIVNSPFYGFRKEITTLSQAVAILGMKAIRTIALCVSMVNSLPDGGRGGFDYTGFWERSFSSAIASRLIAQVADLKYDEEAFICGLTQNIGSLILGTYYPNDYGKIIKKHYAENVDLVSLELKAYGIDHAKVAYEVFKYWKMPSLFAEAILYHHEPDEVDREKKKERTLARIVNVSDLVSQVMYEKDKGASLAECREELRKHFKFSDDKIDMIMEQVSRQTQDVAAEYNLKVQKPGNYAEIVQSANRALELINLDYEQINRELTKAKDDAERLADKLKVAYKKLEEQAITDGLTGLFNHRFFYDILQKEFANAQRYFLHLGCIMFDIDFFKKINDTFGHPEGDKILSAVGAMFKGELREGDIAARYGGEEFALLLPNTTISDTEFVAERIRMKIENTAFTANLGKGKVTISAGVTCFYKKNFKNFNEFIDSTDKMLYKAKQTGRNRVVVDNGRSS